MFKRLSLSVLFLLVSSMVFSETIIPKEAIFKGKLVGRNVFVEGIFDGTISMDGLTDISEDGIVKGTIETTDLMVEGSIEGTILAVGDVTLKPTATVTGNLQCRGLLVEKGALLTAVTSMGELKTVGGVKKVVEKKATTAPGRRSRRSRRSR